MAPEPKADIQPAFLFDVSADLLDFVPNALGVLALDGTIRAVNRAALKLLNFHSSAIIGRHFSFFLHTLHPPLLIGGFPTLLDLGNAFFDVALRCGGDFFVQVEIQLVVLYDDNTQPSGVLVMSSEGDAENFLLRQAVAKVAEEVSRMITYESSNPSLWPKIFALCQKLFETPSGWLLLHGKQGEKYIPFTFGPLPDQFGKPQNGVSIQECSCRLWGQGEPCAVNSMDCPWLAHTTDSATASAHHAVVPILRGTGKRVADICLVTPVGRIFHSHELSLMDAIADQIGQALDRGEVHLSMSLGSWDRLTLTGDDNASPELIELFEQILATLATLVPFVSAGVFLQESEGMRLLAAVKHPQAQDLRGHLFPAADNLLFQKILQTRSLIILDDVRQDARFQLWGGLDYIRGWMGLPLVANENVIGIITVDSDRVGVFSQRDGEVAQAFADQAAIAVEKARLTAELGREKRNLELLHQLNQNLIATLEPDAVANNALALATAAFDDCFGEIYIAENGRDRLQLLAARNHSPAIVEKLHDQPYLYKGVGIFGGAIEMRRLFLIPDVNDDPRWLFIPEIDVKVRSMAAIPLIARNEVVGALILSSQKLNTFNYDYLSFLQSIAASVALALQNARLFAAERKRRQEAETLRDAAGAVALDLRLEQILRLLLERLRQVVYFDSACVMLLEGSELHALAELGLPHPAEVVGHRFPVGDSFFTLIQRERRAIYYNDIQKLARFSGWGGTSTTRGWMGVPLIHRGDVLGYITLDSLQVGSFGEQETSLAQAFANQMSITIVNAQLLAESQQAAFEQQEISGVLRRLNGALSLMEIQAAVAGGLHRLIHASAVEIALYREDEQHVSAQRSVWTVGESQGSTSPAVYGFDESRALPSLLQGQSYIAPDITQESQWPVERAWAEQGYHAQMALPLQGSEGILGHIQLFWRDQLAPAQAIHFSLRQVCDGVAMAAERLTLLQQTTRRAAELQRLVQISGTLRSAEGSKAVVQIALAACLNVFRADRSYVLMPTGDETLEVISHAGDGPIAPGTKYSYTDSIAGRVFCSGVSYCSPNLFADPSSHKPTAQIWGESGLTFVSALYAALRAGDQIIGVISLTNGESKRAFTQADLRLLDAMAEIIGGALHRATILEDLEQRVAARTTDLAQANAQLRELDQLKSDFVANVSHELRTPLTNIKLYLELLGSGRAERRSYYLQVAKQETEQLQALIESILDISALDEDRAQMALSFENVLLNEVAEMVFERFRQQAADAGLHFIYPTPPQPWTVWGSQEHLFSLCANLVSNAIRYTQPGGSVEIILKENEQGKVGILVRDTGMGIHPDEIPLIFERFYRSTAVKQSDILGTGLGLSIVNEIAQAHGAHITVDSEPHAGTTFAVWFPLSGQDPRPGEKIDAFQ